jgi:hypothetical protein
MRQPPCTISSCTGFSADAGGSSRRASGAQRTQSNQLVTELRAVIADLRQARDHWRDAFAAVANLPTEAEANSSRTVSDMREAVKRAFAATGAGG